MDSGARESLEYRKSRDRKEATLEPVSSRSFVVETDASNVGLGAVLRPGIRQAQTIAMLTIFFTTCLLAKTLRCGVSLLSPAYFAGGKRKKERTPATYRWFAVNLGKRICLGLVNLRGVGPPE